jgi:type II secretory pathway pseudopilin PulG
MMRSWIRTRWRRDVLVGLLASVLTAAALGSVGWAALLQQRERAEEARHLALQAARLARQEAAQARDQAQRALVDQAADVIGNLGGPANAEAEALRVSTAAVAPEIPQGAYVLIDKKAATYAVGDIVVFRVGPNNLLGRVVALDREAGRITVGRNQEANRQIALGDVLGRAVLNTR